MTGQLRETDPVEWARSKGCNALAGHLRQLSEWVRPFNPCIPEAPVGATSSGVAGKLALPQSKPFDRAIFMTTSVFTQQAEEQAASPGYKPIDLIDGERLLELLQEYGLGIMQLTVVDEHFFAPSR